MESIISNFDAASICEIFAMSCKDFAPGDRQNPNPGMRFSFPPIDENVKEILEKMNSRYIKRSPRMYDGGRVSKCLRFLITKHCRLQIPQILRMRKKTRLKYLRKIMNYIINIINHKTLIAESERNSSINAVKCFLDVFKIEILDK